MIIGVVGGGAWGTALAALVARNKHKTFLWARNPETVTEINLQHKNSKYLPGIRLPDHITATGHLNDLKDCELVLCVTPAQSLSDMLPGLKSRIGPDATILLCSKGIDRRSGKFPHEIAADTFSNSQIAALSGPSFAHDVARGKPTAVVVATEESNQADRLAAELSGPTFRIYASTDIAGVEAGGALKNVLALAVGIARGLDLGASAEAALIARGFAEITRLATALGARSETLMGLSGLGDLVLTCSSPQSRNFAYGMALGRSESLEGRPLAEGVHTADMAQKLALRNGIDAPIMATVSDVLGNKLSPSEAVHSLLSRPLKSE